MSLTALIDKYKTDLAVATEPRIQEVVDRYKAFGSELVRLPSFTYTRNNMREVVEHMTRLGFSIDAKSNVASYAMRRAAMEQILDVSDRDELFRILDISNLEYKDSPRLREAVEGLVERIGKPKVKAYLSKVQEGLKAVAAEVDELYEFSKISKSRNLHYGKVSLLAETGKKYGRGRYTTMGTALRKERELYRAMERAYIMEGALIMERASMKEVLKIWGTLTL